MGLVTRKTDELFQVLGDGRTAAARPAVRPAAGLPPAGSPPAGPGPVAPPRPSVAAPAGPAVRVSPTPVAVSGMFASLLPSAAAGGRPAAAASAPTQPPAASQAPPAAAPLPGPGPVTPPLFEDDDTPILVIDDSAANLFNQEPATPRPFFARTFAVRGDTAAVGAFFAAIALGISFLLGRASTGRQPAAGGPQPLSIAAQPGPSIEAPQAAPPVAQAPEPRGGRVAPPPLLSLPAELAGHEEPAREPAADRSEPPAARPAPALLPAAEGPLWWITVLQKGTKDGAEDVKKLLESKGFRVTLEAAAGDRWSVHVGGYADRRAPEVERDLAAVRKIQYKGRAFHDAFVESAKRSQ
jgi:hypothetical protein